MTDLIDEIDALVDEQLAGGPQDDYNRDRYDRCPHCGRHWHGLPITERIADMYSYGIYDETYSAADDDSPVLCRGSDFIGPMPAERRYETPALRRWRIIPYREHFAPPDTRRWWRLPHLPAGAEIEERRESRPCLNGAAILHIDNVTLTVGDDCETWGLDMVRTTVTENAVTIDVLTELPPRIGGTWEPLTAPGSTRHPDTGAPSHPLGVATSAPWRLVSDTDNHAHAHDPTRHNPTPRRD